MGSLSNAIAQSEAVEANIQWQKRKEERIREIEQQLCPECLPLAVELLELWP